MATLNRSRAKATVFTHEGAPAKRIDNEAQLRRSVMACMLWESQFYEDGESIADRIAEGVRSVSQETAAAIAIEAREQMHLRHVPLLIVREMARRGGPIVGDTLARVIQRADELSEFLAIYWKDGKEPLSAQVKKGLARAFTKFDEYQLAKYDRAKAVRLRDVLFLCHAKPKSAEQAALWGRLIDGTMAPPGTWENELSGGADKKAYWTGALTEGSLGGLALLRNLRNMQEVGVDEGLIREAIGRHTFPRVLPFRFIAAARYAPTIEDALEEAMLRALKDAPTLHGRTTIVVDHSISMKDKLSKKSDMTRFDAACGLAIMLREVCASVKVVAFSSPEFWRTQRATPPHVAMVPPRRGFALRDALEGAVPWYGTNTEDGKKLADEHGYDRIIIITDEQSHQKISDPVGKGYVINVASHQNGIGYGAWTHIDGWSEAVVKYIQEYESVAR